MAEREEEKPLSGYQKYLQRKQEEIHNPKPPSKEDYVRLSEAGRKEYMKYVKKAYEMMFFWIGFGGLLGYFNYKLAPMLRFLRERSSFSVIRKTLTAVPILLFSYHGIKFMTVYKRKGVREVVKDPNNVLSEEAYQEEQIEQAKLKSRSEAVA